MMRSPESAMIKNVILVLSLALNAVALWVVSHPPRASGPKMTCAEAINEDLNKEATRTFARENDGAFLRVHDYPAASDYRLRNVHLTGGAATFVYVAKTYPSTCGSIVPGIDGSIVRVKTNLPDVPAVTEVY